MMPIRIRIREDDHTVVTQLLGIELDAQATAESADNIGDFLVRDHLRKGRLLRVEHLAAEGQNGLVPAIACLLGRASGRVALDNEEFTLMRSSAFAVRQLAGQIQTVRHR